MADRHAVLLVFCLFWRCALTGRNGTLFQKSPLVSDCRVNGKDIRTKELWGVVRTPGTCAHECSQQPWCNSFRYKPLEKDCFLCSLQYLDSDVLIDNGRIKYFRATSNQCSLQDGFIWDRRSNLCLLIVSEQELRVSQWEDAAEGCNNRSLRLVSLNTPERLDFVTRLLPNNGRFQNVDFFIGARRPKAAWGQPWPQGVPDLQWLGDGSTTTAVDTADKQYWAMDQPDNQGDGDNVLLLRAADSFLLSDGKEHAPSGTLGYVCDKDMSGAML